MARAGLFDHRKFKRLVHELGEPVPHCAGYLECLWTCAYQARSAYIGTVLDVGLATQFPGDPDKITKALVGAGFVDVRADGAHEVHDLHEHAPQHVKRAMERNRKCRRHKVKTWLANGQPVASQWLANDRQREENREERIEKREPPLPPSLQTKEFEEALSRWLQHRSEIKKSVRPTQMAALLRKFESWGPARAVAAIDHSIEKGWQGVFEPQANGKPVPPPPPQLTREQAAEKTRRTMEALNDRLPKEGVL